MCLFVYVANTAGMALSRAIVAEAGLCSEEEEEGLGFVLFAENKRTEMYHGAMGVVELPCKHGHAYG